jgi:hypothetical protein
MCRSMGPSGIGMGGSGLVRGLFMLLVLRTRWSLLAFRCGARRCLLVVGSMGMEEERGPTCGGIWTNLKHFLVYSRRA